MAGRVRTVSRKFFLSLAVGAAMIFAQEGNAKPSPAECRLAAQELQAMKKAEAVLFSNMTENNETMASTLDQYAGDLKVAANQRRPVTTREIRSLSNSAQAFRQHKVREQKLVSKFDQAASRVLNKVESCLNQ